MIFLLIMPYFAQQGRAWLVRAPGLALVVELPVADILGGTGRD
jgi:hypothetical protein